MKKRGIVAILIGIILIFSIGIFYFNKDSKSINDANAEKNQKNIGETTTLIHKDFKAIIKKDWQEFELPPNTFVYLPPKTSKEDIYAESILINAMSLGENSNFTLESILEEGIKQSIIVMPDFEITENLPYKNDFIEGKKIIFTVTYEKVKRVNTQFFGIKNNFIYSVTYSCPLNNCNHYSVFEDLVNSFEPI